ncbi:zinc finger Ran-binding domain-containing protein [Streptomyces blattellae]|uniref:zinc finger Ran-binding domain-containing protein n=1 Tax=Streptomyces blattellae TaxID=2569855 RepID=UPI0012B7F706|nr:zinc finger Ran-binding domain-containing protein [Streptomyces blattellae]
MSALESLTEVLGESGCGDNSERYARELLAEERREWSAKIREVGTAKGWSTWAAAFLDPDLEFVDTGMPSTATIVAELRRLDRLAVLREVDERLAAMELPEYLKGTLNAGSYADAWRRCRAVVQALIEACGEKGTSGGHEPAEDESTPNEPQALPLSGPICSQAEARSAGLDVAPSVEELNAMAESVVALGDPLSAEVSLAQAVPLLGAAVTRLRARVAELEAGLRIGAPWTCGVCGNANRRDVCVICETDRPDPSQDTEGEG